jgi:hypothetical protein
MKKEFYGFYAPNQNEIDKSWNEGIFVFDANTLLNLYRYSDSTRKDFLMVLSKLKDKLYMPYQVGYEYHSNRDSVIENLDTSYYSLLSSINEICDKNITHVLNQYVRHPSIEVENLKKTLNEFVRKLDTELEKQKKKHPDFKINDEILLELTELYENKVGSQFSKDELKKIYIEGKERYEQQIPPGYKDFETKRKKGEQHIYGDLIIWKEIILFTKREKKEIIFITDDRKEDWWTIENGRTIRPREELIKEFYDLTGIRILIYNADNFLQFAKERKLATSIKEKSITEVKEVRKADEIYISKLNDRNLEISHLMRNNNALNWTSASSSYLKLMKSAEIANQWNAINFNLDSVRKSAQIANQWNSEYPRHIKELETIRLPEDYDDSNQRLFNNISKLEEKSDDTIDTRPKVSKTKITKISNLKNSDNIKESKNNLSNNDNSDSSVI